MFLGSLVQQIWNDKKLTPTAVYYFIDNDVFAHLLAICQSAPIQAIRYRIGPIKA